VKVAFLVVLALLALGGWRWWQEYSEFDAAEWRAQRAKGYCVSSVRNRMVGDLTENHLHQGMTAGEVRQLLGRPDGKWKDRSRMSWEYTLAPSVVDCFLISLRFDSRGRLVDWHEWEN